MKYEYKALNIFAENQKASDKGIPASENQFNVINEYGAEGWKCLNPWDGQTLYFERVK